LPYLPLKENLRENRTYTEFGLPEHLIAQIMEIKREGVRRKKYEVTVKPTVL
jgi:hypothetical protein